MKSWTHIVATIAALYIAVAARGPAGEPMRFDNVVIDAGVVTLNFDTGRIDRIGAGAALVIHPTDPAQKDLRIRAGEISMEYASEDAADPAQVVFDGDVRIDHPVGTITAGHADWDFSKNVIVFTESPIIKSERFKSAKADKIVLDMTNNTMTLEGNTQILGAQLTGDEGGGTGDPSLYAAGDVRDWPALVGKLKAGSAADAASPAKQVIATLDAQSRKMFQGASEAMLLENKDQVVKMLNVAVKSAKLYTAEAWAGVTLDDATKTLVDAAPGSGPELSKMNRALLHAAFPAELAE